MPCQYCGDSHSMLWDPCPEAIAAVTTTGERMSPIEREDDVRAAEEQALSEWFMAGMRSGEPCAPNAAFLAGYRAALTEGSGRVSPVRDRAASRSYPVGVPTDKQLEDAWLAVQISSGRGSVLRAFYLRCIAMYDAAPTGKAREDRDAEQEEGR